MQDVIDHTVSWSIGPSVRRSLCPLVRHAVAISYLNHMTFLAYLYATDAVVYTAFFMSNYYHYNADILSTNGILSTDGETQDGRDLKFLSGGSSYLH